MRRFRVLVCRGPECGDRRNSKPLFEAFRDSLERHGLTGSVELGWQSCFGRCTHGPNAIVREVTGEEPARRSFATLPGPRGATALYNRLDLARVERIVVDHVTGGLVIREFIERIEPLPPKPPVDAKPSGD